ncbi:glycoside hydrolase family 16 protein [Flavobacterium sp.]|uniref:glycoside hydrolase family 16 protein n=1 Tax=Flavobacterium sp. TaxID=239 RepID=UPI00286E8260|nr:glycoside hydrolase family 16 protein [Flavobacterium sp.]
MQNFTSTSKKLLMLAIMLFVSISCSSSDSDSNNNDVGTPSNLNVTAEIVGKSAENPNGDGTGIVKFTINATNATSFKIALGDGVTKELGSGVFSYTYNASGTNNYTVIISAYNGVKFVSKSFTIVLYVAPKSIWSDEFNGSGAPDSSKWGYDLGAGGWGNNESQNYTNRADNVKVENGVLKIIAKKESYQGSNYTSARLLSKGKFSVKYGKIEFRAKLPVGGGTWPALWMLGDNIGTVSWPACGEIDIMEHVGNQLNKIHGTLHYTGRSGGNADSSSITISNTTTEFHIYSIDWRAENIKFYVDNQLFKTFVNSANVPFNQNFFLIMNCAMEGNFGGAIDPNFVASTFEVDYVRVYN